MKKLLLGLLFCFCSLPLLAAKGQINLVGPVGVQINAGWSQWSAKLNPIKVNPIQVMFWSNGGQCRVIPVTNVSVKYSGDDYWYTATFRDRYFYVEEQKMIEGVKLDFYLDGPPETCVISVYGYREIGGGI